jgi:hypothetical protein
MWRTFKELRAAERAESDPRPSSPSEDLRQASRLPDRITYNGVEYVRGDISTSDE